MMKLQIINFSLTGIVVCLFVLVGNAAVDLVPCDKTRRVFTNSWGVITDGPLGSNYTQDSHCEWLIKANGTNKFITLSFHSMKTECSYDYVFVYDGDSFRSPLLGSFSGKTEPQQVIASSGYMLILLYSDTNYVLDGFRAEFSITACPNNCSSHGVCYNNHCVCDGDRGGHDCSKKLCPEECGVSQGRGSCDEGQCVCNPGYSGQACSLSENDTLGNKWHWLSHSEGGLSPRAAHTAVYVQSTDSIYVFGGYNLNNILSSLEIYSFKNSSWTDELGQLLPDHSLLSSVDPASVAKLFEHAGEDWQKKWGLTSKQSYLRNFLYAASENTTFQKRTQRHSQRPDLKIKPDSRYGHAACHVSLGFVMFGGKLDNGVLSNDLWLYNVRTHLWEQRALFSLINPPALTRHTLTAAGDIIYLFGGSTEDGEFSSKLFSITLQDDNSENWVEIKPRGGKELDVRVVAHSTVYHSGTNSLLVYGGIVAGVARFSKLSDRMFAFQINSRHWSEIHYTREYLRDRFVPRERAFHTANILGNYLIIFGGYSHRHNKEEICYDNQMYLYHLGCHTWVNPEILGKSNESRYPKQQGVFAHAASVRNGNTLLLVGGYHGNVNGDLLAYTVPPMIAARLGEHYEPEVSCPRHRIYAECSADPECGWCSADESCYGRTVGANCTTNLQTTRCPGVCPALGDCHSCLIHGHGHERSFRSAAHKLGLAECTWCVQNARCHHKDDNYGVCGLREDSPSQMPGWWGPKGTEVLKPEQCRELDRRPGLTFVKYHHPVNFSQPDHVAIINATTVDFNSATSQSLRSDVSGGKMVARLIGFLRPPPQWTEMLKVCISYCNATLRIADNLLANVTADQKHCEPQHWPEKEISTRVAVDFESHKIVSVGPYNNHQQSKMELQHYKEQEIPKVFTFEYLEPYANGSCHQYHNCLHCLTDSQCGWCDASNTCVSRSEDESISCVSDDGEWRYLTLQPSACSNCSNYISCESCVNSGLCEWWIEEARCSRRGLSQDSKVAIGHEQCPTPCYKRENCSTCLEQQGRCVWCEATQQCFSFSVYTSEYQFGLCREWLDQPFPAPIATPQDHLLPTPRIHDQCKSCAHHTNCSTCLSSLSCGWCYNSSNPISGKCVQGDFNNPHGNCSDVLNTPNARWAYAQCPDVDECGLGLHDCNPEAICTNTDGSYSCHCKRGFIGDGRTSCTRTCYNVCVHGTCQGEPDYSCKCDLGWTGEDCSINCGCNNHSNCNEGVGKCDECENWTEGEFCEFCKAGSFGNATTEQGCKECECNGHGNQSEGECDIITGICHCKDNTEGDKCDRCKPYYYGDPRGGKQCYYQCEARGMLNGGEGQGISSRQAYSAPWGGPPTRECLWIINPLIEVGSPIIQLQMNASDLNVTCGENAVYVYDGLPELVDMGSQSALSAVFCSEDALPSAIVESRTGQLTVHYKQGLPGEGFSAMYSVIQCEDCQSPRHCKNGLCVCKEGFIGADCSVEVCPKNCSSKIGQGNCDYAYGRCLCTLGWGGSACDFELTGNQLVFVELFNTSNLADHLEHLRKTLPRFGHSLASDRRGSLWMFGGYSLSHGPLNDIRLFDTRNSTWMQVTVDSTPDAKMPLGRYFHGSGIVHSKQAIFVYGGLTKQAKALNNRTLDDFWQFDIQNQRWNEIERDALWPPAVSGHTLTSYRNSTLESLILIGGVSPQHGFLSAVWEYRLDRDHWHKWETRGGGPLGIFGHSTVFNAQSNSLYIFGGYTYEEQQSVLSDVLYVLNYDSKTWTNLNTFTSSILPGKRFLHSAVTTDTHMYILGGRMSPWNITDTLYAYSYNCNQWINLISEGIEKVGPLPQQTYAQAMTTEPDGDSAYIIGGWGSDTQCSVLRLELPKDICSLWPNRDCLKVPDCGYCALKFEEKTVSETCHSHTTKCPFPDIVNRTKHENRGKVCEGPIISDNCTIINECASCTQISGCQWCDEMCTANKTCAGNSLTNPLQCAFNNCLATDCIQCHQLPGCDWSYTKRKCVELLNAQEANSIATCAASCTHYKSCSECLDAADCRWSTQLDECISASYQKLYCAGGVCGLVLQTDDRQYCPEPCSSFTQCASCLRHGHCGWCAGPGTSGDGVCTEGSNERPMLGTCDDVVYKDTPNKDVLTDIESELETNITYSWYYVKCPPEDECTNDHHSCNPKSERCVDLEEGFECVCGPGYKASKTGCEPVCLQGCVRGQCTQPNNCMCDFGYVGANCSIQCQCNGHANCEGPDKLDKCLQCFNNTMGAQCEKCQPLFVGDPSDGGQCVPCLEYCYGHSNICLSENSTDPDPLEDMDIEDLIEYLKEGPKGSARCLRCINKTAGTRCDECIPGNFRGSEDHRDPCRACDCHGHGDTCDPVTGEKCNCKNNTESDVCPSGASGKNSAKPCWMVQCSKCKEGYLGTPENGHQCYKQMNMDFKMCFDAKPIDECKMKPKPLHPGEMVFFVIQPRYMNVDIRVIIDVTQGQLNIFMSTRDDTYVVHPNQTTAIHEIEFDPRYLPFDNKTEDLVLEKDAIGLRTYITIKQTKTMLAVKGLKDRLVITLPEEYHSLESTRFYLVLQAVDPPETDKKVAYGIVFFKQDQLHIDLFVFFSVFFSCFFLFLAACVVAWKAKQAADVRRARRRHVVEMLHMAKRPFASVTLNLGPRSKPRRNAHYDLRPVAVEPTDDGLAAVATVFVSLPGGQSASVKLALASSLILLARQFPSGGRAFLRRRSTHAAPPT